MRGASELRRGETREIRDERRMMRSVRDLGDVWVSEIMTHRRNTAMVDADLPLREIVERVLASPYTRMPVWKDTPDNIIGVLHTKGLLRAGPSLGGGHDALDVQSIASPPWFLPDSTTLLAQPQAFPPQPAPFPPR